jgi:glutamate-ammonia-ligase adenylyltransferase
LRPPAHPGLAGAASVFERLLSLLATVARRSAYLALVIEHPPLLPRLANLMGASAWAAHYLTQHPLLLDELLDASALLAEPGWDAWRAELARLLAQRPDDAEHQMDVLRHFQHAQTFRLLVQDLGGRLTSNVWPIICRRWRISCSKRPFRLLDAHARTTAPPTLRDHRLRQAGRQELGYASDLDLVFVFDVDADDPDADVHEVRYTRLGQRLNTWLTSTTPAGQLRTPTCGCVGTAKACWCRACADSRTTEARARVDREHQARRVRGSSPAMRNRRCVRSGTRGHSASAA